MIMASEVGVYDVDPADVVQKGRLMPGEKKLFFLKKFLEIILKKIIFNFQEECFWLIHLKKVSPAMKN